MISQLQKHFQQVSSKLFSPPIDAVASAAAATSKASKLVKNPTRGAPAVPPAPTSLKKAAAAPTEPTIIITPADDGSVATAMAQQRAQQMGSTSTAATTTTTTITSDEAVKFQKTKSKAARIRSIQHAMSKERSVREAQEPFDFWTNVQQFNWKALAAFMVCWTLLGYYVIPLVKGWKSFTPPTEEEKNEEYNKGKQKFVEDTYRLRQRLEARKMRAERLETLGVVGNDENASTTSSNTLK